MMNTTAVASSATMKALLLKGYGGLKSLCFDNIPRPTIGADEILVQVHAVGLNPIDTLIPKGMFKPVLKFRLPAVMGSDLAGVVVETGSAVTRFKAGDAVFASVFDSQAGSLAEYVAVPERAAALKPERLDFVQAASLPMVALTSWQAFTERTTLSPGDNVFIPAGSGGIGSVAIQLAKYLGARVATTTSAANAGWVKALGADEVIDYRQQQFADVLSHYDTVLGTVRGDGNEKALRILKPQGKLISLTGPLDAAFARQRGMNFLLRGIIGLLSRRMMKLAEKHQIDYSFLFVRADGQQLAEIAGLIDAGHIRPVIDSVFPFADSKAALDYLAQGHAKGKVVVTLSEP